MGSGRTKGGDGSFEVEFGNRIISARAWRGINTPAAGATVHDPVTRYG